MADRWIECECPLCGVDFDIDEPVSPDSMVRCASCGCEHRAGSVGQLLELTAGDFVRIDAKTWRALFPTTS